MRNQEVKISTIKDYINKYRNLDVSYDTLYMKEVNTTSSGEQFILPVEPITLKYMTDLEEIVITKTFTGKEERKYFYNPQVLSYDLYGSTQYWYLLLELNEMTSAMEFNRSTIKVYNGSLPAMINAILAAEEKAIKINQSEITDTISQNNENFL